MGEAIETTQRLYPGLLEQNTDLDFMLKCRQFVEMVNGTDSEIRGIRGGSPRGSRSTSRHASPAMSPSHSSHPGGGGGILSGSSPSHHHHGAAGDSVHSSSSSSHSFVGTSSSKPVPSPKSRSRSGSPSTSDLNALNSSKAPQQVTNGTSSSSPSKVIPQQDTDIDMDSDYENGVTEEGGGSRDESSLNDRNLRNGVSTTSVSNGSSGSVSSVINGTCQLDDMDTDEIGRRRERYLAKQNMLIFMIKYTFMYTSLEVRQML